MTRSSLVSPPLFLNYDPWVNSSNFGVTILSKFLLSFWFSSTCCTVIDGESSLSFLGGASSIYLSFWCEAISLIFDTIDILISCISLLNASILSILLWSSIDFLSISSFILIISWTWWVFPVQKRPSRRSLSSNSIGWPDLRFKRWSKRDCRVA